MIFSSKQDNFQTKRKEYENLEKVSQVADIVLIRHKKWYDPLEVSVRKVLDSYWNHVGFVFSAAKKHAPFNKTIIIEALRSGIELHKLDKYTSNPDRYDVGLKRVPGLKIGEKRKIRAFMMQNVDIPYNFPQVLGILWSYITGREKKYFLEKDAYICSGFIQRAFYYALKDEKKVLFKEEEFIKKALLGYITPKDLAKSRVSKWVYNERY